MDAGGGPSSDNSHAAPSPARFAPPPPSRERDAGAGRRGPPRPCRPCPYRPSPEGAASRSASATSASTASSPWSQNPGSREVDPQPADEHVRPVRAAGGQQLAVAPGEAGPLGLVPGVEREHEQLAERVGVDVARRVDKVGDVAPPVPVPLGQLHGLAVHGPLRVEPVAREVVRRQLAPLAAVRVDPVFEPVHRHLAEDGRHGVVDLADQEGEPVALVLDGLEHPLEREHLAEDARRLGRRERRVGVEHALVAREVLVDAVAQLVGERLDVAERARVVHQDVRVGGGHGPVAERAAPLARRGAGRRSSARRKKRSTVAPISASNAA